MTIDVTKMCADCLRSHLSKSYNIKLKSGHAHEIVAAVFGYQSNISLKQDNKYPIANIEQAEFIILEGEDPSGIIEPFLTSELKDDESPLFDFVEQRIKKLNDLPPHLPPIFVMTEVIHSALMDNPKIQEKIRWGFKKQAIISATEHLKQYPGHWGFDTHSEPFNHVARKNKDTVIPKIAFYNPLAKGEESKTCSVEVTFLRVAGNIGYTISDIKPYFCPVSYEELIFDEYADYSQ